MEMGERTSEMMAYPGNGEESKLSECGQDNVHGSGAHADLPTETADRWVGILGYYFCGTLHMYYFCVCVFFFYTECKLTTILLFFTLSTLILLFCTVLHSQIQSSFPHESF